LAAALRLTFAEIGEHRLYIAIKLCRVSFTRPPDFGKHRISFHGVIAPKGLNISAQGKRCAALGCG
jgi:hypothetical protein